MYRISFGFFFSSEKWSCCYVSVVAQQSSVSWGWSYFVHRSQIPLVSILCFYWQCSSFTLTTVTPPRLLLWTISLCPYLLARWVGRKTGRRNTTGILSLNEEAYKNWIFSILSGARAWTRVILAGKRDSRRHSATRFSENVVVVEQVNKY